VARQTVWLGLSVCTLSFPARTVQQLEVLSAIHCLYSPRWTPSAMAVSSNALNGEPVEVDTTIDVILSSFVGTQQRCAAPVVGQARRTESIHLSLAPSHRRNRKTEIRSKRMLATLYAAMMFQDTGVSWDIRSMLGHMERLALTVVSFFFFSRFIPSAS